MEKSMRKTSMALMIGLAASCLAGTSGGRQSADIQAITAIENQMAAAQGMQGVTRTWDDNVVWYDLQAFEIKGKSAADELTEKQFQSISNLRTKILRMNVDASGTLGYANSIQEFIADAKGGGAPIDFIFRETDIFVKKAGTWHLVHQHLSVPVNLGTGKAVVTNKE